MRITVTITRQIGCGGSFLGQQIAENLGAKCLDREIVSQTAQKLSLDEAELAEREERGASFWQRMLHGITGPPEALYQPPPSLSVSDQELFETETAVMKTIAAREDCVIVGRLAAHVLPRHAGMVNLSLYASLEFRIPRIREYYGASDDAEARAIIAQSDETRKRYITQRLGKGWDEPHHYHLCLDTSSLPLPEISEFLTDFVRQKLAAAP